MPSNPAGHLLQRLIEIGRRNTLRGDVRFGVAFRMSAFGSDVNETAGPLQVRVMLLAECSRALPKDPIGPSDPDGPPFR